MSEKDVIKKTGERPITKDSIKTDLVQLGVKPGMVLIVHSALSKIGWVSGGAVAVIQALNEVLGTDGTLVMPTHTGDWSDPEEWSNPPVPENWKEIIRQTMPAFDLDLTPTRGMGRIPETFRGKKGVIRSNHPQMSFAAFGKDAALIAGDHSLDFGLGDQSPLARVYDLDGWILLLGVSHENNTSLHLAEFRSDFPGKKEVKQGAPLLVNGKREWVVIRDWEDGSEDFEELGKAYQQADGTAVKGKVGLADSILVPQRELVDFGIQWMAENRKPESEAGS